MEFKLKDGRVVELRQMNSNDCDAVLNYTAQMATETIFTNQYPGQPEKDIEQFKKAYDSPNNCFMGAFDGERVVGVASFHIMKPNHPWSGHSASFGITLLKEVHGNGLSKVILGELYKWARGKKLIRIEGNVRTRNQIAINLYLKEGFVIEGCRQKAAFINGEWHDEYYIAKFLDEGK